MVSSAKTGFFYTTQRLRVGPRLSAVKYDPRGVFVAIPRADIVHLYYACLVGARVLFMESKKSGK